MSRIEEAILRLSRVLSLLFYVIVAIMLFEITRRYVFASPTGWVHETTIFLCSILFAFSGLSSICDHSHIRITIFYDRLGSTARKAVDAVLNLLCALLMVGLTWSGWMVAKLAVFAPDGSLSPETSGTSWNPAFPAISKAFLGVMFGLMALVYLLRMLRPLLRKYDA